MQKNKIILTTLSPKTHRTSEENLGIEYLKSMLVDKKYQVEIIDAWLNEYSVDEVFEKIKKVKDEILFVGISSYMSNTQPSIELISKLKQLDSNIKIVCGGFGPTFYPKDYLNNQSDYVILGEGEETICELAECIENNKIPVNVKNVGYKKGNSIVINDMRCLMNNLDDIPFPSRDNMDVVLKKKSTVNMVTSRGCSGNCEFCSVIAFFRLSQGKVWRTRSIKNIVDEIEMLYKQGVKYIKMVDDSFVDGTRDEKWCHEFANEIQKRKIRVYLRGQIRADKVTDSILYDLKRAGFFSFACGIENGSSTALARMNKTASLSDNEKALKLFQKYGYLVQMGFILFDKETTMQELIENYEFLNKYDFVVTKGIFSEMYSAEGTKLNNKLKKNKSLIISDFVNNNNRYQLDSDLVKLVYDALKIWHKSHSDIYDMTIDPLTAPKAITPLLRNQFYYYSRELKKQDLIFFRNVLSMIQSNDIKSIDNFVQQSIDKSCVDYANIRKKVKQLYLTSEIEYNAIKNPFID